MGHQRTCRTRNPTSVLTPGADIPNPSFRERPLRAKSRRSIDASLFLGRGLAIEAGGSICDAEGRSLAQPGDDIRPIMVAWAPHDGPWKEKLRREESIWTSRRCLRRQRILERAGWGFPRRRLLDASGRLSRKTDTFV